MFVCVFLFVFMGVFLGAILKCHQADIVLYKIDIAERNILNFDIMSLNRINLY